MSSRKSVLWLVQILTANMVKLIIQLELCQHEGSVMRKGRSTGMALIVLPEEIVILLLVLFSQLQDLPNKEVSNKKHDKDFKS